MITTAYCWDETSREVLSLPLDVPGWMFKEELAGKLAESVEAHAGPCPTRKWFQVGTVVVLEVRDESRHMLRLYVSVDDQAEAEKLAREDALNLEVSL